MGIVVERGKRWEKTCRKCISKVIVIATGDDICCCPYCGATLMDYETTDESLHISLTCVQGRITEYLNATQKDEKARIKPLLASTLNWLRDDLDFFERNQRQFHYWSCSRCDWTGFSTELSVETESPICPRCSGEARKRKDYRS